MSATPNTPPVTPHPLKVWDRTVRRFLRDVARGQAFRQLEDQRVGTVRELLEDGVAVQYEDGTEAFLEHRKRVEIPFAPAPLPLAAVGA